VEGNLEDMPGGRTDGATLGTLDGTDDGDEEGNTDGNSVAMWSKLQCTDPIEASSKLDTNASSLV
jgi:hypothetical protein